MKENDCLIHPVMGLGTTISSKGYIVFMKSRAGNVKFYNWVAGTLIPEAVDQIAAAFPEITALPEPECLTAELRRVTEQRQCLHIGRPFQ